MTRQLATRLSIGLALALGGLAAWSCTKYPSCKKDGDCRAEAGESCLGGVCQNCKTDADCVARTPGGQDVWTCNAYRCGPPDGRDPAIAAGGEEGDPCLQRSDCYGGLACREGACSPCSEDAQCAPSTCNLGTGRCGPEGACETDGQCAMDEICDGGMCVFSGDLGDEGGGPCGLAAVYFAFDSDEITPKALEELGGVAGCIASQGRELILEAHADDRGTEEYNILLTERRGRKVQQLLVDGGVPVELLKVLAKGSLEATGRDESGRSRDRRVAFIWPE
ncbi:MAG: OmpA family protein [Myxococcales bacterium]|nr:OmpA family protein [Myxococcales bacterium]